MATVIAVFCVVSGLSLIGMALASQRPAPHIPDVFGVSELSPRAVGVLGASSRAVRASGGWWLRRGGSAPTSKDPPPSTVTGPVLRSSKPVSLTIPSIGVASVVQHLGQDPDGALEVPRRGPRYNEAAWYRYSPTPGALGPAILLGHVDSAAEGPSVFFRLGELKSGDLISVTRADESTAVFSVDAVHRYSKDDFPTEMVYGDIDHAGLRILTCGGAFDRTTRHYLDNIVVFASLVDWNDPRGTGPPTGSRESSGSLIRNAR